MTYTSQPLQGAVEITGVPIVTLNISSIQRDGALFVYLEGVAPDGTVTYITEGQIRLLHRAETERDLGYTPIGPVRSFERNESAFMTLDTNSEVRLELYAISVLIKKGHAIRIAIDGHDAAIFSVVSEDTENTVLSSYVALPVKVRE